MSTTEQPVREVWIVARREIVAALGRRGFVAGTALMLATVGVWVLRADPAQPMIPTEDGVRAAAGFGTGALICLALTMYGIRSPRAWWRRSPAASSNCCWPRSGRGSCSPGR